MLPESSPPHSAPLRLDASAADFEAGFQAFLERNRDTDENVDTAARYGVVSIPTLNVYVKGQVVKTIVGAHPKPKLLRELEEFIA